MGAVPAIYMCACEMAGISFSRIDKTAAVDIKKEEDRKQIAARHGPCPHARIMDQSINQWLVYRYSVQAHAHHFSMVWNVRQLKRTATIISYEDCYLSH